MSIEHRRAISIATREAMQRSDVRQRLVKNQPDRAGENNSFFAKKHSEESLQKMRDAHRRRREKKRREQNRNKTRKKVDRK